ncbi:MULTISPECIES: hypothetical protein [Nocardiaceae]|uniref:Uncharacterized protein n=1 Tax=Rhodococcoides kroppenstedtii TaxID=293050 RepID=A0ABS7NXY1_9NOCA|nr:MULTISPECIES: hypothetical protein [Rhodococcus]MBY6315289.1 hypothetical protein [Rhodococcus kroppenstedtii]MBY6322908.1 hypothetical protein [Rhodococcus kroppenstedtii]MBY6401599.1 hypothetical protein [Rhodococcus kroppenstedtii]
MRDSIAQLFESLQQSIGDLLLVERRHELLPVLVGDGEQIEELCVRKTWAVDGGNSTFGASCLCFCSLDPLILLLLGRDLV